MTYSKTFIGKLCGAAALCVMMSTGAHAQDTATHIYTPATIVKTAQLDPQATSPRFTRVTPTAQHVEVTSSEARPARRIIREALPVQHSSVRNINTGRVYNPVRLSNDKVKVYKPRITTAKMPNLYVPPSE